MKKDNQCQQLCTKVLSEPQINEAKQLIEDDYSVEWCVPQHGDILSCHALTLSTGL
jgi:hypothetical protein